jgi:glyoxylase-like metal-dependent hydrolase (beta-lactamase superfamily II)
MPQIHHLNCGTLNILGRFRFVLHCLLVKTSKHLVLVDTGFGTRDYQSPGRKMGVFLKSVGVRRDLKETALFQLRALGYEPGDVSDIFMTHMHVDHTGGLRDFPGARVHLFKKEFDAVRRPIAWHERWFYIRSHWDQQPEWVIHALQGDRFYGNPVTAPVKFDDLTVQLLPLEGHSRGHCGVLLHLLDEDRYILHAGDSYVASHFMDLAQPFKPPPRIFSGSELIYAVVDNVPRLRQLKKRLGERQLIIFCAHAADELENLVEVSGAHDFK